LALKVFIRQFQSNQESKSREQCETKTRNITESGHARQGFWINLWDNGGGIAEKHTGKKKRGWGIHAKTTKGRMEELNSVRLQRISILLYVNALVKYS